MKTLLFTSCMLLSLSFPSWCLAERLIIEGPQGLRRLVQEVQGVVTVQITLPRQSKQKPVLVNVDGIASDVQGEGQGLTLVFRRVAAGTWRIKGPRKLRIDSVKVVP